MKRLLVVIFTLAAITAADSAYGCCLSRWLRNRNGGECGGGSACSSYTQPCCSYQPAPCASAVQMTQVQNTGETGVNWCPNGACPYVPSAPKPGATPSSTETTQSRDEAMEKRVALLESDMKAVKEDIKQIRSDVTKIDANVSTLLAGMQIMQKTLKGNAFPVP